MKNRYADYVSVLLLVLAILWFCQDLVFKEELPFFRDLTNYFYPLRYSLYASYRAGELPLWDRHFAQGFPNLAAFQSGVFYPPHFVFFFLPFYVSIRALFIFHFLIAAIGAYGLLRRWCYSWDLSLVGSVLFALGGLIVSLTNLLNHFQSAVWLPLLVLTWERALVIPKWRTFVTFTIVAALQFLAGSPEMFAMSMGLALLDGFRMRHLEPEIQRRRILGLAIGATLLMLAMTMAQFLPTAELVMASRRGQSIPAAEAFMWSLNPSTLMNLFFLDKEVETGISIGVRLFFAGDVPLLVSGYLGVITLFGIALWLYYGARREKLYLTALALASLAIAMGGNALIYPLLFRFLPFVSAFRFPEKFFFVTYALVLFMTMKGLKGLLLDRSTKLGMPAAILGTICLAWLCLYFYLRFNSEIVADFIAMQSSIPPISDIHAKATVSVLTNLQRQAILALALFFLLILFKTDKIRPLLFSTLLVAVVYVDLASAHRSFLFPLHPNRVYGDPPVVQTGETRLTRFFYYPSARDLHPAYFSVIGRPTFEQSVALSFQNYLPNVGVMHGIDYFQEIDALNRGPYTEFLTVANNLDFDQQIQLLRTFNVKYVVSFRKLEEKGLRLVRQFPKYFSWLYEIEGTVPRTYIVSEAVFEEDPLKVIHRLSMAEFDPTRKVILDQDLAISPTQLLEARADIQGYENSYVTIRAVANKNAILVLADSFYPGWRAFVDGVETKIFRANHFFRAVVLPKGEHRIEFRYEPQSFVIGAIVSIFTLACVSIISVHYSWRRRKLVTRSLVKPLQVLQD